MRDAITIQGTVETVLETETFASGFTKRVLVVLTDDEKYPQTIPIEFVKDKTSDLDGLQKGQRVTAHVNLRGREYNGKYFANIQGWRLEKEAAPEQPATQPAAAPDEHDDIPF